MLERVDPRIELGRFLASRRARLTPGDVGLASGRRRRVAGLRREEVAVLAHISETWYSRLEQGQDVNASVEVLENVARALRLDEHERAYLLALAGSATRNELARDEPRPTVTGAFAQAVQALVYAPAVVYSPRYDLLFCNAAHRVVFGDIAESPIAQGNVVRQLFLDPSRRRLFPRWEHVALGVLKNFRLNAGRYAGDPAFAALAEELREKSELFREGWDRYDVIDVTDGEKDVDHPLVGKMQFDHASFAFDDRADLKLIVYTTRAGSESERKVRDLVDGTLAAPSVR
jgi:transcriptional regulator with XRE-family HTH domain